MLSYSKVFQDQRKVKDHLKEASDSFGNGAKKAGKPPLFGEKFHRAVIDRGTLLKQLKEAKQQIERRLKPRPLQARNVNVQYSSPLQRVNQPQQQTQAQTYQTQPFHWGPAKKSSGRGRGARYIWAQGYILHTGRAQVSGCKSVTLAPHDVVGEKVPHELTFSVCSIEQDFQAMVTPVESSTEEGGGGGGGLCVCVCVCVGGGGGGGGGAVFFIQNWVKITQDPWVLSVVRDGYQVEWLKKPFQVVESLQTFFSKEKSLLIDQEVQDMVSKGATEKVSDCPGQFVINFK